MPRRELPPVITGQGPYRRAHRLQPSVDWSTVLLVVVLAIGTVVFILGLTFGGNP